MVRSPSFGLAVWLISIFVTTVAGQESAYELRSIENSESFSQVIAVNSNLDVLGTREIVQGPTRPSRNFFRAFGSDKDVEIPIPNGFTNIEVQALSDSGLVVGYVSRPVGNSKGSLFAFAWDSGTNELTILEPLPEHGASHAQDVSADGRYVTGYCTGTNPPGLRPCVWSWNGETKKWDSTLLDTVLPNNPYLQSSQLLISPNGKQIAGCITVKQLSEYVFVSSLFVWDRQDSGKWERRKLSDDQFKLKDMNDHGVIVGCSSTHPCMIDAGGKLTKLELLPGDESGCAYGVNNDGMIVGLSDDPHGAEGGPQATWWRDGKALPLRLRANTLYSAALALNANGAVGGYMVTDAEEDALTHAFLRIPGKQ